MADEDIKFRAKLEGSEALRMIAQLSDGLKKLLGVQKEASQVGQDKTAVLNLQKEIAARKDAITALQAEVSARGQASKAALAAEVAVHQTRIRLLEEEARKVQEVADRTAKTATGKVTAAQARLNDAQQAAQGIIKSAQVESEGVVATKRRQVAADAELTRGVTREMEKRVRLLAAEGKAEAAEDKKRLQAARDTVRDRQKIVSGATTATGGQKGSLTKAKNAVDLVQTDVRDRAEARRVALESAREELRIIKENATAKIAAGKVSLQAVIDQEKAKLAAVRASAQAQIKVAQDQLNAAKNYAGQATAATRQQVQAAQQAVRIAKQNATQAIAGQRQQGQAAIAAARQQVAAARTGIAALQQQAAALRATGAAALQYVRNSSQIAAVARTGASSIRRLVTLISGLASAYLGLRSISGAVAEGLKFNEIIEFSTLGIATLITAEARLRNEQGKQLDITTSLTAAQGLATEQIQKLRIENLKTAATFEQLVDAFQQGVASGVKVGLTLDQIRRFTVNIAKAAGAVSLPFSQLNQEVRSILDGTIDRNSRLAKGLNITNAMVAQAKEQNRLAEFLEEKFAAFNVAGEKFLLTWKGVKSNIADSFQLFAGESTLPFFERIRDEASTALGKVFDLDNAAIAKGFRGLVEAGQTISNSVGAALADGIKAAVAGAEELSKWFHDNKDAVTETVTAFGTLVRESAALLADIFNIAVETGKAATTSGTLVEIFRTMTGFVDLLRDNIEAVKILLITMVASSLVALAIVNPIAAAVVAVATLLGVLNKLNATNRVARQEYNLQIDTYGRQTAAAIRLGEQYIALNKQIESGKLKGEELKKAQVELAAVGERLINTDDRYTDALDKNKTKAGQVATAIRNVTQARFNDFNNNLKILRGKEEERKKQIAELEDEGRASFLTGVIGEDPKRKEQREAQIKALKDDLKEIQGSTKATQDAINAAIRQISIAQIEFQAVTLSPTDDAANQKRLLKSIGDELQAAKARLKSRKAEAKTDNEIEENKYKQNLIASATYFNTLEASALGVLDVEKEVADAELKLAKIKGDEGAVEAAKEHQKAIEEARIGVISDFTQKRLDAAKEFAKLQRDTEIEVLETGDVDDRLIAAARAQAEKFRVALETAFREKDFKLVINISRLIDIGVAKSQFEELQRVTDVAETALSRRVQEIQANVDAGVISQQDGARQLAEAYTRTQQSIEGTIDKLLELQPLLKDDPSFVAFLEAMQQRFKDLSLQIQQVQSDTLKLKIGIRDALEHGLADFLEQLGSKSTTAAGLFRGFVSSVIADIRRLAAQLLAQRIIFALFKAFSGAGNAAAKGLVNDDFNLTPPETLAKGGQLAPRRGTGGGIVVGPGTPTSDSVPLVWVSRKEFVEPAHAVDYYTPQVFEALRQRRIPRQYMLDALRGMRRMPVVSRSSRNELAMGGSLSAVRTRMDSRDNTMQFELVGNLGSITVQEDGLLRVMGGKVGRDIILRQIGKNPNAVAGIINR